MLNEFNILKNAKKNVYPKNLEKLNIEQTIPFLTLPDYNNTELQIIVKDINPYSIMTIISKLR